MNHSATTRRYWRAHLDPSTTLERLFNKSAAQKMLLHFWQKIHQKMHIVALSQFKPEDIYYSILRGANGKAKPAKILQQIGTMTLIRSVGIPGLSSLISSHANNRTWQRMKKDIERADILVPVQDNSMAHIQRCLETFEPLKITNRMERPML